MGEKEPLQSPLPRLPLCLAGGPSRCYRMSRYVGPYLYDPVRGDQSSVYKDLFSTSPRRYTKPGLRGLS